MLFERTHTHMHDTEKIVVILTISKTAKKAIENVIWLYNLMMVTVICWIMHDDEEKWITVMCVLFLFSYVFIGSHTTMRLDIVRQIFWRERFDRIVA
jgi:hypothetical protein